MLVVGSVRKNAAKREANARVASQNPMRQLAELTAP